MTQIKPWTYTTKLLKSADEPRVVYGIVYSPCQKGEQCQLDTQKDWVRPDALRKAAWDFLAKSRKIGYQHKGIAKAEVVESFVAPMDMAVDDEQIVKGSWVIAVRINDTALWKQIEDGSISAFSLGGRGVRVPAAPS